MNALVGLVRHVIDWKRLGGCTLTGESEVSTLGAVHGLDGRQKPSSWGFHNSIRAIFMTSVGVASGVMGWGGGL